MTRVDDCLRRQAAGKHANRLDECVPVPEGQVGAADRAREQDVAGEQAAVCVVGQVRRRMAGHLQGLERDPAELERLVALQQDVGRMRPQRQLRGREVVDSLERGDGVRPREMVELGPER